MMIPVDFFLLKSMLVSLKCKSQMFLQRFSLHYNRLPGSAARIANVRRNLVSDSPLFLKTCRILHVCLFTKKTNLD